ncbi:HAMP domain-containing histidine kinase [Faecalicatena sp. AGMB00832]|uniref:histidine kinase n=1 Tax=Faecalicatena faecalis TaxID=2726362 RepID=A0ABS6D0B5_9FIRM|nr:HAMP domain-containing histidine kinase [Faecalicatena faecalis]
MKSIPKLIRRFFSVLLISLFLILFLNFALLYLVTARSRANAGGWDMADKVSAALIKNENGQYILGTNEGQDMGQILKTGNTWAILIDKNNLEVTWHSEDLPSEIPLKYDINMISFLSRAYLKDYPTTTSNHSDGLIVLGFPKDRYWKHIYNTFDYQIIANAPKLLWLFLTVNLFLILFIYLTVTTKLLKTLGPIVDGIQTLPDGQEVYIKEIGLFSEIAQAINRTSEKLRTQERKLRKQEQARANWIAGVSHDIRTPLSMIMGYAGQLEDSPALNQEQHEKAAVIQQQSIRMKNLINDLNLASKLEYNMQPLHTELSDIIPIIRQTVVDFMNLDVENKFPIDWEIDESLTMCMALADKELLKRAVSNLIINAQVHNPQGCILHISVIYQDEICSILVEDDGIGISEEQLLALKNTPHYMLCDSNTNGQRHGLGLMIVRQIAQAHGGTLEFDHGKNGGFLAVIRIPAFLS